MNASKTVPQNAIPDAAIILAAGTGSKLWPYGDTQPKAVIPVANRPIVCWQLDMLQEAGIKEIIVATGHLGGEVKAVVGGRPGVRFVEQPKPAGTADALSRALAATQAEQVLVVWGDALWTPEDLSSVLDRHSENPDHPTLLAVPLGDEPAQNWLCPTVHEGKVTAVYGHPREGAYRSGGLLAMPRNLGEVVERVPEHMSTLEVGVMPVAERELLDAVNLLVRSGGTTDAVIANGLNLDIDKPWHILEATECWLKDQAGRLTADEIHPTARVSEGLEREGYLVVGPNAVVGGDVKLKGTAWVEADAKVIDGAILCGTATIGKGALVHQYCQVGGGTAIGHHCVVGHGAEFSGVLMDGAYSYHYGEYWGVIGRGSDLGAATVCGNLRFDDLETAHRTKGRREVPRRGANAAYLGDYVRTGVNCILMPGVKVGPYSVIGAGVILNEDIPNRTLIYAKQELVKSHWGPERYGW